MRYTIGFASLAVATALAVSAAYAAGEAQTQKAPPAKTAKPAPLRGDYAVMAQELKLSDEQQDKIRDVVGERGAKISAWKKENASKLAEKKAAYNKALQDGDKDKAKESIGELRELSAELNTLYVDMNKAVMEVLTPPQRAAWQGILLNRALLKAVKDAEPTDEQKAKIKDLAVEATKALTAVDAQLDKAAQAKALEDAKAKVLTDEQRAKMEKVAAEAREKAAEAKAKAAEDAGKNTAPPAAEEKKATAGDKKE